MSDTQKPSQQEEEYFAREEIEKLRKLAVQQHQATAAEDQDRLKQLHFMKCPKCGMDLHAVTKGKVVVDTCFNCHGVWLDAGELERMLHGGANEQAGSVMRAILNFIKKK